MLGSVKHVVVAALLVIVIQGSDCTDGAEYSRIPGGYPLYGLFGYDVTLLGPPSPIRENHDTPYRNRFVRDGVKNDLEPTYTQEIFNSQFPFGIPVSRNKTQFSTTTPLPSRIRQRRAETTKPDKIASESILLRILYV